MKFRKLFATLGVAALVFGCTSTSPGTASPDSGVACKQGAPPSPCNTEAFPACAPDWNSALAAIPKCDDPRALNPYLARCGSYDAIVSQGRDNFDVFFYSTTTGALVGHESNALDTLFSCESYDPSFEFPRVPCVPIGGYCPEGGTGFDAGK